MSEKQAREQGYKVVTSHCAFAANGKALAMHENFGFIKIVSEAGRRKIFGVHMIGSHVTELIAGPAGMITHEQTAERLARLGYPHPSMGEGLMEAAQAILGKAICV